MKRRGRRARPWPVIRRVEVDAQRNGKSFIRRRRIDFTSNMYEVRFSFLGRW